MCAGDCVTARDGEAVESLVEPELLASAPGAGERRIPEDIREYRAERYRAAGGR
jgi:hypothetical protein